MVLPAEFLPRSCLAEPEGEELGHDTQAYVVLVVNGQDGVEVVDPEQRSPTLQAVHGFLLLNRLLPKCYHVVTSAQGSRLLPKGKGGHIRQANSVLDELRHLLADPAYC